MRHPQHREPARPNLRGKALPDPAGLQLPTAPASAVQESAHRGLRNIPHIRATSTIFDRATTRRAVSQSRSNLRHDAASAGVAEANRAVTGAKIMYPDCPLST